MPASETLKFTFVPIATELDIVGDHLNHEDPPELRPIDEVRRRLYLTADRLDRFDGDPDMANSLREFADERIGFPAARRLVLGSALDNFTVEVPGTIAGVVETSVCDGQPFYHPNTKILPGGSTTQITDTATDEVIFRRRDEDLHLDLIFNYSPERPDTLQLTERNIYDLVNTEEQVGETKERARLERKAAVLQAIELSDLPIVIPKGPYVLGMTDPARAVGRTMANHFRDSELLERGVEMAFRLAQGTGFYAAKDFLYGLADIYAQNVYAYEYAAGRKTDPFRAWEMARDEIKRASDKYEGGLDKFRPKPRAKVPTMIPSRIHA